MLKVIDRQINACMLWAMTRDEYNFDVLSTDSTEAVYSRSKFNGHGEKLDVVYSEDPYTCRVVDHVRGRLACLYDDTISPDFDRCLTPSTSWGQLTYQPKIEHGIYLPSSSLPDGSFNPYNLRNFVFKKIKTEEKWIFDFNDDIHPGANLIILVNPIHPLSVQISLEESSPHLVGIPILMTEYSEFSNRGHHSQVHFSNILRAVHDPVIAAKELLMNTSSLLDKLLVDGCLDCGPVTTQAGFSSPM